MDKTFDVPQTAIDVELPFEDAPDETSAWDEGIDISEIDPGEDAVVLDNDLTYAERISIAMNRDLEFRDTKEQAQQEHKLRSILIDELNGCYSFLQEQRLLEQYKNHRERI